MSTTRPEASVITARSARCPGAPIPSRSIPTEPGIGSTLRWGAAGWSPAKSVRSAPPGFLGEAFLRRDRRPGFADQGGAAATASDGREAEHDLAVHQFQYLMGTTSLGSGHRHECILRSRIRRLADYRLLFLRSGRLELLREEPIPRRRLRSRLVRRLRERKEALLKAGDQNCL